MRWVRGVFGVIMLMGGKVRAHGRCGWLYRRCRMVGDLPKYRKCKVPATMIVGFSVER